MRLKLNTIVLALAGLLLPPWALADTTEVYHWVDENGVAHFSQTGPNDAGGEVRKLALENPVPSGYDPDEDIFGVEQQAQRMKELRESMEAKRQARLEAQRKAEAQRPVVIYQQQPAYRFGTWIPGLPSRPPVYTPVWPGYPVPEPYPSVPFLPSPGFDD